MSHTSLLAVTFGLLTAVAWGFADFFGAKTAKKLSGFRTAFLVSVIATTLYDLIFVLFFRAHATANMAAIVYAGSGGIVFTLAMISFYKGLELGPVSLVSPLGSLYPLVTAVLLVALFGNHLNFRQELGIGVVILGVLAASGLFERIKSGRQLSVGPLLGLLAAVCWGVNFALLAQAIDRVGWQFATLVQQSVSTLAFLIVLPLITRSREPITIRLTNFSSKFLLGAGLLQAAGFWLSAIGIDHAGNLASIVVAASACYPIITVILALRHFGEKFDLIPIAGACLGIAGIVILSLG